jgi:hypothetical protein
MASPVESQKPGALQHKGRKSKNNKSSGGNAARQSGGSGNGAGTTGGVASGKAPKVVGSNRSLNSSSGNGGGGGKWKAGKRSANLNEDYGDDYGHEDDYGNDCCGTGKYDGYDGTYDTYENYSPFESYWNSRKYVAQANTASEEADYAGRSDSASAAAEAKSSGDGDSTTAKSGSTTYESTNGKSIDASDGAASSSTSATATGVKGTPNGKFFTTIAELERAESTAEVEFSLSDKNKKMDELSLEELKAVFGPLCAEGEIERVVKEKGLQTTARLLTYYRQKVLSEAVWCVV